jgi:hypothetical protein
VAIALAAVVFLVTAGIIAYVTWFLGRPDETGDLGELAREQAALRARLSALIDRVPAAAHSAPDASGPMDLGAAEALVASAPEDGRARAHLAWALLERGDLDAALGEAARARTLGGGALAFLIDGRAAHAAAARAAGPPEGPGDPATASALLTRAELAILQRERARRRSGEPMPAAVAAHLRRYQDAMARILAAAETEPGWVAALHQAARVAIKIGLVAEGRALFDRLEPLAVGVDESAVRRDLAQLRSDDVTGALIHSEPPSGARRSPRLRILR